MGIGLPGKELMIVLCKDRCVLLFYGLFRNRVDPWPCIGATYWWWGRIDRHREGPA